MSDGILGVEFGDFVSEIKEFEEFADSFPIEFFSDVRGMTDEKLDVAPIGIVSSGIIGEGLNFEADDIFDLDGGDEGQEAGLRGLNRQGAKFVEEDGGVGRKKVRRYWLDVIGKTEVLLPLGLRRTSWGYGS